LGKKKQQQQKKSPNFFGDLTEEKGIQAGLTSSTLGQQNSTLKGNSVFKTLNCCQNPKRREQIALQSL
jgi:hypothetical protein